MTGALFQLAIKRNIFSWSLAVLNGALAPLPPLTEILPNLTSLYSFHSHNFSLWQIRKQQKIKKHLQQHERTDCTSPHKNPVQTMIQHLPDKWESSCSCTYPGCYYCMLWYFSIPGTKPIYLWCAQYHMWTLRSTWELSSCPTALPDAAWCKQSSRTASEVKDKQEILK